MMKPEAFYVVFNAHIMHPTQSETLLDALPNPSATPEVLALSYCVRDLYQYPLL